MTMGLGGQGAPVETERILVAGRPDLSKCDNSISTSKYTLYSFLPVAIREQFRRVANVYFLVIGGIMAVGYYTTAYDSAISPWTTLGPLALVVSVSMAQEAAADVQRHRSDDKTNNHPCVVLRRGDELDEEGGQRDAHVLGGRDINVNLKNKYHTSERSNPATPRLGDGPNLCKIGFESVARKNIRAGNIVMVKNREMLPADLIILASSADNGSAYIETSSIDGETNLKLRTSPHLPSNVLKSIKEEQSDRELGQGEEESHGIETLEQATKRIARSSALCFPSGISSLENPSNPETVPEEGEEGEPANEPPKEARQSKAGSVMNLMADMMHNRMSSADVATGTPGLDSTYVSTLTSETPNPSVNTYSGKLTLPPVEQGEPSIDIPLNAENILLRGAILRNTEWAIGLAVFTGTDTKLVQNSFETPSKFSQLDKLMNKTVFAILFVMITCICALAGLAVTTNDAEFDKLWYLGWNKNETQSWPYLPDTLGGEPVEIDWVPESENFVQLFFLYVTLLSNFVPLSLYVTIEICVFCLMWLLNQDIDMYHEGTDTPALARSTIVTDLGQVQYVFSDKTGTLTQNVMRFKRCSVDGMVFGAPVEKSRPTEDDTEEKTTPFHPLRRLLVGRIQEPSSDSSNEAPTKSTGDRDTLTFNAEMFLRVMSICHTVVVEKDFDAEIMDEDEEGDMSMSSTTNKSLVERFFGRKKSNSGDAAGVPATPGGASEIGTPLNAISEHGATAQTPEDQKRVYTFDSLPPVAGSKGADGAPAGFNYQAESPDEGALVSASSKNFDFQVSGRDSNGVKLSVVSPSLFQDETVVKGFKDGTITPRTIAAETAADKIPSSGKVPKESDGNEVRTETWSILAVNKFDSDRKRMSVLVRSPEELGSIPMLLCKGADSSMLCEGVCGGFEKLMTGEETAGEVIQKHLDSPSRPRKQQERQASEGMEPLSLGERASSMDEDEQDDWESATLLGIQSHLGDFAKEGLRTLVLGVRVLTEDETTDWLNKFKTAAASINNREERLTAVAYEIEKNLHIVGATAIEDKLQRGVPETISTLEKAGIKLWVLTGDKRETAIEIGYSTHVLTDKMHLTEVADGSAERVRTVLAMEFMRLIKMGKLKEYQKATLSAGEQTRTHSDRMFDFNKKKRACKRSMKRMFLSCMGSRGEDALDRLEKEEAKDATEMAPTDRRQAVRALAEKIIQGYLTSPEGMTERDPNRKKSKGEHTDDPIAADPSSGELVVSDEVPVVFRKGSSARAMLDIQKATGRMSGSEIRTLSLAQMTSEELQLTSEDRIVDEDILSLESFVPGGAKDSSDFDKKRRNILERIFAVDSDVRHGRLRKHVKKERLAAIAEQQASSTSEKDTGDDKEDSFDKPRALVIEGAALYHLLGDPLLEEILFGVASNCDSVIACRVSPKQKALVVKLVRNNVSPEPVTLAIGDGANDVGMIQEAHVGVGISGLEGQQAVNASDFAIAQFRYLEELLLIHGRWNFYRMSVVVLFSFYKNAIMAGTIIIFAKRNLYSGTPLFDQWAIAVLNFVAGMPIGFLGVFDRYLEKDYILKHPEVYASGRNNELLTVRTTLRWIIMVFVHVFTIYYLTLAPQAEGGGITPAFSGLMSNYDKDFPGDGEGGDLTSIGIVAYSNMILLLGYKVLYESKSIIHGQLPSCNRNKEVEGGIANRLAYTWIGVLGLSYGFYLFFLYVYQELGANEQVTPFFNFVKVTEHVLHTRSMTWMLLILVPIAGISFDVIGKVFSNMYYPTQTQIHLEIASKKMAAAKRRAREERHPPPAAMPDVAQDSSPLGPVQVSAPQASPQESGFEVTQV